jgi:Mrp family chromosome partitioning ATPase
MEETTEVTQRVNNIRLETFMQVPETPISLMGATVEEELNDKTQVLKAMSKVTNPQLSVEELNGKTHTSEELNGKTQTNSTPLEVLPAVQSPKQLKSRSRADSKRLAEVANARVIQERCRQICLSIFFHEHAPVRSLGFTSSIAGEGKSFLTMVMANVLAHDSSESVTLLECNWEHPCFHEYFGIPPTPGLAEWLRGECEECAIRHTFDNNLTVIPAGDGRRDAVKLLRQLQQNGLMRTVAHANELLVVDLPPVIPSAYGALAASLVESLLIVIRAGVTTDLMVAETCGQLKDLPVQGVILNQMESRVPRWLRQLL